MPAEHAQYLESVFFNYADNAAARALELHLTAAEGWNSEIMSAWSRFVIGVHLRHPDVMPELRDACGTIWDKSGPAYQAHYEKMRTPSHPPTMDEWINTLDPLTRSKVQLNCVINILDNEIVGTHLNSMKWAVIDASQSNERFLTSDRPVEISNLNNPMGFVSVPISPTKLFIAANRQQSIDKLSQTKPRTIVRHVNAFVVSRARKFVWASDASQARFIENRMSSAMEPIPFHPNLTRHNASQIEI